MRRVNRPRGRLPCITMTRWMQTRPIRPPSPLLGCHHLQRQQICVHHRPTLASAGENSKTREVWPTIGDTALMQSAQLKPQNSPSLKASSAPIVRQPSHRTPELETMKAGCTESNITRSSRRQPKNRIPRSLRPLQRSRLPFQQQGRDRTS